MKPAGSESQQQREVKLISADSSSSSSPLSDLARFISAFQFKNHKWLLSCFLNQYVICWLGVALYTP